MKKTRSIALLVSVLMLLISCETDFEINSKWKDITVVYGLLDQTESVHYIKINKAFLGDGDAMEYAAIEDSSSYGGNIEVSLAEEIAGVITREITFDTTSTYTKEPGLFYYPHQVLFKSTELLKQNGIYTLKIHNKTTGKEISATTGLIGDFAISKPSPSASQKSYEFKKSETSEKEFRWNSATNGRRYQVTVRFFFKESSAPGDTLHRYIDWVLPSLKSYSTEGGVELSSSYMNSDFFINCNNLIPYKKDAVKETGVNSRQVERFDFIFMVLGDEISTYMDVSEPSSGVLQEKPEYTNITNGIGVLSCRYSKKLSKKVGSFTETDLINTDLKFVKNLDN
jgi:hypothetical protein